MEHDAEKLRIGCEITMSKHKLYALYSLITDKKVFVGTASECARFCGGSTSGFHNYTSSRSGTFKGYRVEVVQEAQEKGSFDSEMRAAAKKWDEFCQPIREKYGIPVYKAKSEVRG